MLSLVVRAEGEEAAAPGLALGLICTLQPLGWWVVCQQEGGFIHMHFRMHA